MTLLRWGSVYQMRMLLLEQHMEVFHILGSLISHPQGCIGGALIALLAV